MSICKDCENMFVADIMVDGEEYTAASCVKNPSFFDRAHSMEEELGYKCTVKMEKGVYIPIVVKCNFFGWKRR